MAGFSNPGGDARRREPFGRDAGESRTGESQNELHQRIDGLIRQIVSPDQAVRIAAVADLVKAGEKAVPALMDMLQHSEAYHRRNASIVLGEIGRRAAVAADSLTALLWDPAPSVRSMAAWALGSFGGAAAERATPKLLELLRDDDPGVRSEAIDAVRLVGTPPDQVVAAVLPLLGDCNVKVRYHAVWALHAVRALADEVLPYALPLLSNNDLGVRDAAIEAIRHLRGSAKQALSYLSRSLTGGNASMRRDVATAFGLIGAPARRVLPDLLSLLADPDPGVRNAVAGALGNTGKKRAVPALLRMLDDEYPSVRRAVAEALGKIKKSARIVVPELVPLLTDGDVTVREAVARALGVMGTRALADLLRALDEEKNEDVRRSICRALEDLAAPAKKILEGVASSLVEISDADSSRAVQTTAILVLEAIRPRGRGLNQSLIERSDIALAPRMQQSRKRKRLSTDSLKSRLALLDTCLAWPTDSVSERTIHRSLLLTKERMRLGLPKNVSAGTVHNHLESLARMCKLDRLWDIAADYQSSTFRAGAKDRLRQIRPYLEEEIVEEEKRIKTRVACTQGRRPVP